MNWHRLGARVLLTICLGAFVLGCGSGARRPSQGSADAGTDLGQDLAGGESGDSADDSDVVDGNLDSAPDLAAETPACAGLPPFGCILGSCFNDLGTEASCVGGEWQCPPNTVDTRSCHGCIGNRPPNCTCSGGVVTCVDADAGVAQ